MSGKNDKLLVLRTLMPCIRDMARSGLRALNVRIVLKAWIPPAPHSEATKLISDTCSETIATKSFRCWYSLLNDVQFVKPISLVLFSFKYICHIDFACKLYMYDVSYIYCIATPQISLKINKLWNYINSYNGTISLKVNCT